jgi:hypothetical protein
MKADYKNLIISSIPQSILRVRQVYSVFSVYDGLFDGIQNYKPFNEVYTINYLLCVKVSIASMNTFEIYLDAFGSKVRIKC